MNLIPIIPRDLETVTRAWAQANRFLERAMVRADPGLWTLQDLCVLYIQGRFLLYLLEDQGEYFGAVLVEIRAYPRKRIADILVFGVDSKAPSGWFEILWPRFQESVRKMGADVIAAGGRKGWYRRIKGVKEGRFWEYPL